MDPEIVARVAAMSSALSKLPDRPGVTFRGAELSPAQIASYAPGQIRTESAFLSTTADPARDFPGNTLFIIDAKHAKVVSGFSALLESEAAKKRARAFLARIAVVPAGKRQLLTSDKYAGSIAEVVAG